jgi:hypothetical protein
VHPTTSVAKWGGEPGEAGIKQEDNFNAETQREAQRKARGLALSPQRARKGAEIAKGEQSELRSD